MKFNSKIRELLLISIPSLLLLSLAWYWTRVEAVSKPGGSRMFISKVEITPASGWAASQGRSHYLTVTLDHPWPRPKWWGKGQVTDADADALAMALQKPKFFHFRGERPGQFFSVASGGALTWTEKGRMQRFKPKKSNLRGSGGWKDGSLIFRHSLSLQDVPVNREPLTFHGIYFLEGQPPLRLSHVIRNRGEQLQWNRSRDTGGKIASVRATPFKAWLWINNPHQDRCDISITVSHPSRKDGKAPSISESDLEIIDGRGRNLKIDQRNITLAYPGRERKNTATTTEHPFIIEIKRSYSTQEPLTLRGKISVDDNWPIPFSLRLPPR